MKKVLFLLSIGVITLLTLNGCSKEKVDPETQGELEEVQKYAKLNGFLVSYYYGKYSAYSYDDRGEFILENEGYEGWSTIYVSKKSSAYNAKKWDISCCPESGPKNGETINFSINTDELSYFENEEEYGYGMQMFENFTDFETSLPKKDKLTMVEVFFTYDKETDIRNFYFSAHYTDGTSNVTNYTFDCPY